MSRHCTAYCLQIISARGLPLALSHKKPNAYVEVKLGTLKKETRVVHRCQEPLWNENIECSVQGLSDILSLRIKHRSSGPGFRPTLAGIDVKIGELLSQCQNHEVDLELKSGHFTGKKTDQVKITLRIFEISSTPSVGPKLSRFSTETREIETAIGESTPVVLVNDISATLRPFLAQNTVIGSLEVVLSKIDSFMKVVDQMAGVYPYAQLAWNVLSSVYKIVRNQVDMDQGVIDLAMTMTVVYSFVDAVATDRMEKVKVLEDVIKKIFLQTVECVIFIREYFSRNFAERIYRGILFDVAGTIAKLSQNLLHLKNDYDSGLAVQNAIVSFRMHQDVTTLVRKHILLELAPTDMQASDRPECLPATRHSILNFIVDWATNANEHNVLWLYGLAGSGKSTLSTTLASYFRDLGRLGAFLFFDRSLAERSHPSKVIRILAYKLGAFDQRIGEAITTAIQNFPAINDASLLVQFNKLLLEPLSSLVCLWTEGPIVLIFDALDECGSPSERKNLLTVLAEGLPRLPSIFRVMITSRATEDIRRTFTSQAHIQSYELDVTSVENDSDISKYLRHQMAYIRSKHQGLGPRWPGDHVINHLTKCASGLFVWAATVSRFVDSHNPRKRLDTLLNKETALAAECALDTLYRTGLEDVGMWEDDDFVQDFRNVLGVILVLRHPLSSSAIDHLLGASDSGRTIGVISRLTCVLAHLPTVRLLHPSFAEFLFCRMRCGREVWHFDATSCHRHLAIKCLDRLTSGALTRNVCNMTLSMNMRDERLPEDVAYACSHWVDHVSAVTGDIISIRELLATFLRQHLLHWFEAMSILRKSRDTIILLNNLFSWVMGNISDYAELRHLVRDACRFAQTFATSFEDHPLLIYSALPFTPVTSAMYQMYHDIHSFPVIAGGFQQYWSPLLLVLIGHRSTILSISFSHDGGRLVSGSDDSTVRVWDALLGTEVLPELRGHESRVWSVAFSPDGTRIASGSSDRTVRIWDVLRGKEVQALQGHEGGVLCVAYSPDGTRIISGSSDKTIRSWDAISGVEILPALQGHEGNVHSATFSPDGACIVSGSSDKTIRIWDISSGANIFTIQGHEGVIRCVSFSPNGERIVSGSDDRTIRVWNASSGTEVLQALRGHENSVRSIVFCPGGKHIASGSSDRSIRAWDVVSGAEILPALRGHEGGVQSITSSPDGTRIASGSSDKTIRIWDISSRTDAIPKRGHEGAVRYIVFSPDGKQVASGSCDNTIRVWDASSGIEILSLRGHEGCIRCIAFSPDAAHIASGSDDGTIRIWNAASGVEVLPILRGHEGGIRSITYSAEGGYIFSDSDDNTHRVWDASSGSQVYPSIGEHNSIRSCALSDNFFTQLSDDSQVLQDMTPAHNEHIPDKELVPDKPHPSYIPTIQVTREGWVVHSVKSRTICKLPSMIFPCCSAAHERSLAIGTRGGQVFVLHFPPTAFTSPETRLVEGNEGRSGPWLT